MLSTDSHKWWGRYCERWLVYTGYVPMAICACENQSFSLVILRLCELCNIFCSIWNIPLTSYFSVVISQNCNISAVQCVKHAHLLHLDDYGTYFSDVCIIATQIRNLPTIYCNTGKEFAIYTILWIGARSKDTGSHTTDLDGHVNLKGTTHRVS